MREIPNLEVDCHHPGHMDPFRKSSVGGEERGQKLTFVRRARPPTSELQSAPVPRVGSARTGDSDVEVLGRGRALGRGPRSASCAPFALDAVMGEVEAYGSE